MLLAVGYTAFEGFTVYQSLENGRAELVAGQASLSAAQRSGDNATLHDAADQLARARKDFADAQRRSGNDPAMRALRGLPGSGPQVTGAGHLAAIGADLSQAGQAATTIAMQVAALKQRYAGRSLSADDLQAILQQAQGIASNYKGSIASIGQQLKAAHQERAQVDTARLAPPLAQAYAEVDRALADADTAFARYQDVRQVLGDLLGVRLSA